MCGFSALRAAKIIYAHTQTKMGTDRLGGDERRKRWKNKKRPLRFNVISAQNPGSFEHPFRCYFFFIQLISIRGWSISAIPISLFERCFYLFSCASFGAIVVQLFCRSSHSPLCVVAWLGVVFAVDVRFSPCLCVCLCVCMNVCDKSVCRQK